MRRSIRCLVLTALAGGLAAAGAASAQDEIYCSQGMAFHAEGPSGWQPEPQDVPGGTTISWVPDGSNLDDSPVAISVSVPKLEPGVSGASDLDDILERRLGMLTLLGDPSEIHDSGLRHPRLPSRSAWMKLPTGSLYYIVVDGLVPSGQHFVVSLARQGSSAREEELARLDSTVASLRFDPSQTCPGDSSTRPGATFEASTPAALDSGSASPPSKDEEQVARRRAFATCTLLGRMYVPIACRRETISGSPALVATLSDGHEPADRYLERYRDRVAATYCWAREESELPPLYFRTDGATASPLREYSCSERGWVES